MTTSTEELVELISFFDAIRARLACDGLAEAGIPFTVEDLGVPSQGIDRMTGPPPVWLRVSVAKRDLKRSQELLRRTMHLFPEAEIDEVRSHPTSETGEDACVEVASGDAFADAEAVREVLRAANIASSMRELTDDDEPGWRAYAVDVQYDDADRAFRAIERWSEQSG